MIYLMRHGLDDEKFVGGQSNIGLVPEGVKGVINSRNFIINNNIKINKIYTSDLSRAKQTADIINERLNIPIEEKKYLREIDKGILNGIKLKIAKEYYSEYINNKNIYKRFPEGESLSDFYNRILYYFHDILNEDNTLVITHRGVINMIYFILTNTKIDYNKERFNVTHSSIHEYNKELKKIRRIY